MTQRPARASAAGATNKGQNSNSTAHNVGINHDDNVIDMAHYLMGGVSGPLSKESEVKNALDIGKIEYQPVSVDVRKRIERVLGCKLMAHDGKIFIQNTLKQPNTSRLENPREEQKDGFLMIVLTMLFMLKNPELASSKVTKTMLWEALGHLGLEEDHPDQFLGDLKELISSRPSSEFVAKGWVVAKKAKDEADEIYFEWGPRALATVDAFELLKKYHAIMGIGDLNDETLQETGWKSYMNRAQKMRKDMRRVQEEAAAKFSNSST